MGNAIVKLVNKVKIVGRAFERDMWVLSVRRRKVHEDQGRKVKMILSSSDKDWLTPSTTKVNASGGGTSGRLSPITLKLHKLSPEKLDTGAEQVNTAEGVNTGSIKLSTGNEQVSTVSTKKSTLPFDKGSREGQAICSVKNS
ncbi:hypothetical protein Tco_0454652 [Tanacetum coccineum]